MGKSSNKNLKAVHWLRLSSWLTQRNVEVTGSQQPTVHVGNDLTNEWRQQKCQPK